MDTLSEPKFFHHVNGEGEFVSVCSNCFARVAVAARETELKDAEQNHVCDSTTVEIYRRATQS